MSETANQTATPTATESPKTFEIPIHFSRNINTRSIHSNGAWFSQDVQGNIRIMFYNEFFPTPKKIVALVDDQGKVVGENESKREIIQGTVREIEVDVSFSIESATQFHKLLGENLEAFRNAQVK